MSGILAGVVICPHGKMEAACRECDFKARATLYDAVALAVMAERERCAKIADNYTDLPWPKYAGWGCDLDEIAAKLIADQIRSGE